MTAREHQGLFAHIQPLDRLGSRKRCMDPEGPSMGKHLQHLRTSREPRRHQSILPLIAEPTGLLSPLDIDKESGRPLLDLDRRRAAPSKKTSLHRQPL
ncbi:MAG: hypothetical protein JW394_0775 [Nitrospira sp.]|nr:hypothetical protein [Nitrospira sp.]